MSVAKLVNSLIGRAKAKEVELKKSNWERYREIVAAIHAGREDTDVDELEAVLEALGKTPEALTKDVETYAVRLDRASQLAKKPTIERTIATLTAKAEKLTAERDEHWQKMNEQIFPLTTQVRELETELLHCSSNHDFLLRTCDDPSILQREQELEHQVREIMPRYRDLEEELKDLTNKRRSAENAIEATEERIKRNPNSPTFIREEREKLVSFRGDYNTYNERLRVEQAKFDEVNEKIQAIRTEQAELAKRKLIP